MRIFKELFLFSLLIGYFGCCFYMVCLKTTTHLSALELSVATIFCITFSVVLITGFEELFDEEEKK